MKRLLAVAVLTAVTVLLINTRIVSDLKKNPFGVEAGGASGEPRIYRVFDQAGLDLLAGTIFNGGDEILFKRGSSFRGQLSLKRSTLRTEQVITISDFGSADARMPLPPAI